MKQAVLAPTEVKKKVVKRRVERDLTQQDDPGREPALHSNQPILQTNQPELAQRSWQHIVSRLNPVSASLQRTVGDKKADDALGNFRNQYKAAINDLEMLKVDVSGRVIQFSETFGNENIEDYSDLIFANTKITTLLKQINQTLKNSQTPDTEAKETIADMLLMTSLIPSRKQVQKRTFGPNNLTRQTFDGLSPTRLVTTLIQIDQKLRAGGKANTTQALEGLDMGQQNNLAQRMLKLSLINALPTARLAMQGSPLFQKILNHSDIVNIIMGTSGGAIEQQFLNTCTAAAMTQFVQTQVINLASLLHVGRVLGDYILAQATDEQQSEQMSRTAKGKLKKVSLRDYAMQRVIKARLAFTEIEYLATQLLSQSKVDEGAFHQLTRRWGREMQKLSAIADLSLEIKAMPVLTKKTVKEHWNVSAALSLVKGLDRGKRRLTGINVDTILGGLSESLDVPVNEELENLNTTLGNNREERRGKMPTLWQNLFDMGGSYFGQKGHSLFMRAIVQGEQKMFAIGDPVINRYELRNMEQMEEYIRKAKGGEFSVPKRLADPHPLGYFVRDDIKVYRSIQYLEQNGKYEATVGQDTKIDSLEKKEWQNRVYYQIMAGSASGVVKGDDVVALK